jgi:hypothetical protein
MSVMSWSCSGNITSLSSSVIYSHQFSFEICLYSPCFVKVCILINNLFESATCRHCDDIRQILMRDKFYLLSVRVCTFYNEINFYSTHQCISTPRWSQLKPNIFTSPLGSAFFSIDTAESGVWIGKHTVRRSLVDPCGMWTSLVQCGGSTEHAGGRKTSCWSAIRRSDS